MVIFGVDLKGYSSYEEAASYQIRHYGSNEQRNVMSKVLTYSTVCERGELCAVAFEPKRGSTNLYKPVRVVVFRLVNNEGESVIQLRTQIDLPGRNFASIVDICFSQYMKDFIIIYGNSMRQPGEALGYDCLNNKLISLKTRGDKNISKCYQIERVGNEIWGILDGGEVYRVKFFLSM